MQSEPQQQGLDSEERQPEVPNTEHSRTSPLPLQCLESDSTAMLIPLWLSFQLRSLLSSALISTGMAVLTFACYYLPWQRHKNHILSVKSQQS